MKDHITCRSGGVIIVAVTMLFCMTAVFAADVTSLRCEYLENPLGIDAAKPRLAWKLETDRKSVV